jgi:hypothetical protein
LGVTVTIANAPAADNAQLYVELWVSLASLLRSYAAAHGLNGKLQATVELGEERITVRHGDNWLALSRNGAEVNWLREDGSSGALEFTEAGTLRPVNPWSPSARDQGHPGFEQPGFEAPAGAGLQGPSQQKDGEEEMDMAAERWARELMAREPKTREQAQ